MNEMQHKWRVREGKAKGVGAASTRSIQKQGDKKKIQINSPECTSCKGMIKYHFKSNSSDIRRDYISCTVCLESVPEFDRRWWLELTACLLQKEESNFHLL